MNFFAAKIVAHGDGFGVVLEGGDGAVLPIPSDRYSTLTEGQSVTFGVRPEHFSPAHDLRAERKGGVSVVVPVHVDMDEPTGAETILMVQISGQEAIIVCEPDSAPNPGQDMDFEIDMQKISLFDPESGVRL